MNYVQLFKDYRVTYRTNVNKGWVNVKCPYCTANSYVGGFNVSQDYYNCWQCGNKSLTQVLLDVLNIDFEELKSVFKKYKGSIRSIIRPSKTAKAKTVELPTATLNDGERRYLKSRGYDPDYLHEHYGVVGGGYTGKWSYRVIIPIRENGKTVSFVGRTIADAETVKKSKLIRYKNLSVAESVVAPKHTFFNLDNSREDCCVLTEGCFDVMRYGDDFVCSMGVAMTAKQIALLRSRYAKIYVAFDNEPKAQELGQNLARRLRACGLNARAVNPCSVFGVKDGGEMSKNAVRSTRSALGLKY